MEMYQQLSQDLPIKTGSLLDCDSCSPDVDPTSASPFPWGCMVWGKGWADWNDGKYQGSGSFYSNCHGDISVIFGTVTSQMLTIYSFRENPNVVSRMSAGCLGDHLHKTKYERTATTQSLGFTIDLVLEAQIRAYIRYGKQTSWAGNCFDLCSPIHGRNLGPYKSSLPLQLTRSFRYSQLLSSHDYFLLRRWQFDDKPVQWPLFQCRRRCKCHHWPLLSWDLMLGLGTDNHLTGPQA